MKKKKLWDCTDESVKHLLRMRFVVVQSLPWQTLVTQNGADSFYAKCEATGENATDPWSSGCSYKLLRVNVLCN